VRSPGFRQFEERGVVDPFRLWDDGVTDADVDLKGEASPPEEPSQPDALSPVEVLDTNRRDPDRVAGERHPVRLDPDLAHVPEDAPQGAGRQVAVSQEVRVTRRAGGFAEPDPQQHSALQDEAVGVGGATEAVKEALEPIAGQDRIRVGVDGTRVVQQASLQRLNQAVPRATHAARASMYGRITRSTRQTCANSWSSAIRTRRRFQASFRASRATSVPTLLRYLKQSAMVFGML